MRSLSRISPLLLLIVLGSASFAQAQSVSAFFGIGTAQARSSGQLIDTFGASDGDALFSTPGMGGVFAKLGGDFMFKPSLGIGAEYSTTFTQYPYAGLSYRPSFYDFNVIWHPINKLPRVVPEFQGGLGGVNLQYYYTQQFTDAFGGTTTTNQFIESSNHFQLHGAAAVRVYLNNYVFVKPQFDIHWVNNFFQFGSSWVPEYSISIGISSGRH